MFPYDTACLCPSEGQWRQLFVVPLVWIEAVSLSTTLWFLCISESWNQGRSPPLKIIRMPFFFPYPFRCGINYLASAFLPLCISLLCRSVSLLFSSSKQVSGLFCCVMWPGVKIRKVSLCSKACNFYFYPQLLELIAKSQLTSLSGIAQKNYMNILEKVVQKGKKRKQWGGGGGVWFNLMYFVWTTSLRIVRQCKMGEEEHHCLFL